MKTKHFILSALFTCVFIACDGITPVVPDDGTRYGEFNLSITYEANGLTVQFSPKHDYSGDLWYEWDFGDGTKSTQKQPTHTYSKNGTYSVVLAAGTPDGRKVEQVYETVTVKEEPKEEASAYFEYTLGTGNGELYVFIKDKSKGEKAVYDFGDGTTKTINLPYSDLISKEYSKFGTYKITVTAYSANGDTKSYSQNITIKKHDIYIAGIEYLAVDHDWEYYKAVLKDDDFFTTTWFTTYWTNDPIASYNLPYKYMFAKPILMDGLEDDEYYTLYIYHSADGSTETQCLKQNISTLGIKAVASMPNEYRYTEISNNSGNTKVRIYFDYK